MNAVDQQYYKEGLEGTYLKYVPTTRLIAPHVVESDEVEKYVTSMINSGWDGRPLLGFRQGNRVKLITGSHRLAAAREVGMKDVPVFILKQKTLDSLKRKGFKPTYTGVFNFWYWNPYNLPCHLAYFVELDEEYWRRYA